MITWVLILFLALPTWHIGGVTQIEYSDRGECEAAREQVKHVMLSYEDAMCLKRIVPIPPHAKSEEEYVCLGKQICPPGSMQRVQVERIGK